MANTGEKRYLRRIQVFTDAQGQPLPGSPTGLSEINSQYLADGTTPDPNYIPNTTDYVACPIPTVPSAPRTLTYSNVGVTTLTLSWLVPTDDGQSTILGYKIYKNGSYHSTTTSLSKAISGQTSASTNTWTVKAYNENGDSVASNSVVVTQDTQLYVPSVPRSLSSSNITETTFTLNWLAPTSDGGASITGYKIYRNGSLFTTVGNVLTKAITGQTAGVSNTWTVKATNSVGDSAGSSALSVTQASPAITTYAITLQDSGSTSTCQGSGASGSTYYSDDPLSGVGSTIYHNSSGTNPVNGGDRYWWNVDDGDIQFKINSSGVVSATKFCLPT